MVFIEASTFTKLISKYLSDDEYMALQWYLMTYPGAGDIVRGSGGVRKIRWKKKGTGKRGGVRIIYYWRKAADEIWLLTIYAKSEKTTIPSHILKRTAGEIEND